MRVTSGSTAPASPVSPCTCSAWRGAPPAAASGAAAPECTGTSRSSSCSTPSALCVVSCEADVAGHSRHADELEPGGPRPRWQRRRRDQDRSRAPPVPSRAHSRSVVPSSPGKPGLDGTAELLAGKRGGLALLPSHGSRTKVSWQTSSLRRSASSRTRGAACATRRSAPSSNWKVKVARVAVEGGADGSDALVRTAQRRLNKAAEQGCAAQAPGCPAHLSALDEGREQGRRLRYKALSFERFDQPRRFAGRPTPNLARPNAVRVRRGAPRAVRSPSPTRCSPAADAAAQIEVGLGEVTDRLGESACAQALMPRVVTRPGTPCCRAHAPRPACPSRRARRGAGGSRSGG